MAGLTKEQIASKKEQNETVLAEVDARIAEMLKAAEEKANAIIEAAEKKTGKKEQSEAVKRANAAGEQYVTIKLFKDGGKYKDDVFVAVNGEGCSVPRGIPVRIKKKFADVLEQSDIQDFETTQYMDAEAARFERETLEKNL